MLGGGLGSSIYLFAELLKFGFQTSFRKGHHPPVWNWLLSGHSSSSLRNVNIAKYLFSAIGAAMTLVVIYSCLQGGSPFRWRVLNQPWMPIILTSFFTQVGYLAAWVYYKERDSSFAARWGWIGALFGLGSIGTALFVLKELSKLGYSDSGYNALFRDRIPHIKAEEAFRDVSDRHASTDHYNLREQVLKPAHFSPGQTRHRGVEQDYITD